MRSWVTFKEYVLKTVVGLVINSGRTGKVSLGVTINNGITVVDENKLS